MIIFRVTTGRSFTKFPTAKDGVPSNPLQFAHQTAESSFLQSTLNRGFGASSGPDTDRGLNVRLGRLSQTQTSVIHLGQEKQNDNGDVEKANSSE